MCVYVYVCVRVCVRACKHCRCVCVHLCAGAGMSVHLCLSYGAHDVMAHGTWCS